MATEQTSGRPGGAVAEMKENGEELVSRPKSSFRRRLMSLARM